MRLQALALLTEDRRDGGCNLVHDVSDPHRLTMKTELPSAHGRRAQDVLDQLMQPESVSMQARDSVPNLVLWKGRQVLIEKLRRRDQRREWMLNDRDN